MFFNYKNKPHALVAIDFNETRLKHKIQVRLKNGEELEKDVMITPREKIEKPLGIPEKLGGNTPEASKQLVNNLAKENAELNNVTTESTILWSEGFGDPLSYIYITDNYGYDRKTVGQTIVHKGTDFRAAEGTEVLAMNDGIVRIAKTYTVYGDTVVIDHGQGVQTLYMHLSKINVKNGDRVEKDEIIGLSGKTGYAAAAHLHISVKVNGVSIDPITFIDLFEK